MKVFILFFEEFAMHCHLFPIVLVFPLHRMWYWCVLSGTWTCQSLCLRTCLCSSGWSQTCSLGWTVLVFAIPISMMLWNRSSKRRNTSCCLTRCLIWVLDLIFWDTGSPAQPKDCWVSVDLVSACECLVVDAPYSLCWLWFQVDKVVQMHETMMTRHTTMIVGPTGGGKSVVISTLCQAQTKSVSVY